MADTDRAPSTSQFRVWWKDEFDEQSDEQREEMAWAPPDREAILDPSRKIVCTDVREAAERYARYFHDHRDGYENTWPCEFVVFDGESYQTVSVDRDYDPVFDAYKPEPYVEKCRVIVESGFGLGRGTKCRKPVVETITGVKACLEHANEIRRVNGMPPFEEKQDKRLYVWANDTDWVVAYDLADVQRIVEAQYGSTFEQEGWSLDEWEQIANDRIITIHNYKGTDETKAMTAAEWIARDGRCFLCSTEY